MHGDQAGYSVVACVGSTVEVIGSGPNLAAVVGGKLAAGRLFVTRTRQSSFGSSEKPSGD